MPIQMFRIVIFIEMYVHLSQDEFQKCWSPHLCPCLVLSVSYGPQARFVTGCTCVLNLLFIIQMFNISKLFPVMFNKYLIADIGRVYLHSELDQSRQLKFLVRLFNWVFLRHVFSHRFRFKTLNVIPSQVQY